MTIISLRDESPIGSMPSDRMTSAGVCVCVDERMSRASGTSGLLLFELEHNREESESITHAMSAEHLHAS